MHILLSFFSATGTTRNIAEVIKNKMFDLGCIVDFIDVTSKSTRKSVDISGYDAAIFGAPVYSSIAPRVFCDWLGSLEGKGKKCAMFFTYGGFRAAPIHYNTKKILERSNFRVVSSAQFPAAHSFNLAGWRALENRPDKRDFELAEKFCDKILDCFSGKNEELMADPEKYEFTEDELQTIATSRFKAVTKLPKRIIESCGMCKKCVGNCPTGAFDVETMEAKEESASPAWPASPTAPKKLSKSTTCRQVGKRNRRQQDRLRESKG